jgi:hypothetical protein
MKNLELTLKVIVPISTSNLLGGNAGKQDFTKVERELRYFANALIRRGAQVVSSQEVAAPAPAASHKGK